jgi:F-type H+-transporting ATPase subunit a
VAGTADRVDPIHQFHIVDLFQIGQIGGMKFAFTNSALFMLIAVALSFLLLYAGSAPRALVPGRFQSVAEEFYSFVHNLVRQVLGEEGKAFFPFIFCLFAFVLFTNFLGLIPYFFTVTSQLVITGTLALFIILMVLVVGLAKHGLKFFGLFVPHGVPIFLLPFISLIEIISFLARPVSLSLRLFGNMLAGHIVLKVFAGFIVSLAGLGFGGWIGAIGPLFMTVAITALEFLVAALQAFVFAVLACVYLKDALHPHH